MFMAISRNSRFTLKYFVKSQKGITAILIAVAMPFIISVVGLCVDGGYLLYSKAKLMGATKFAAISATSYYTLEDDAIVLDYNKCSSAADNMLAINYKGSKRIGFDIDSSDEPKKIVCTVEAQADVPVFFMKIFGVKSTPIKEGYTAERDF